MHHMDFMMTLLVSQLITTLSILFFYCFFGSKATEAFENMSDSLYESNWPNISCKLQKYIVTMIIYMQKPITYHGFKIADLDLGTFIVVRTFWQNLQFLLEQR